MLPAIQGIHLYLLHLREIDGTIHFLLLKTSGLDVAIVDRLTKDLLSDR
ncbi:hypothetical protein [Methanococcoides sp. NM1]